jgi:hypothetical protein
MQTKIKNRATKATATESAATESAPIVAPIAQPVADHSNVKTSFYSGLSSYRNANRKTEIGLGIQKYGARPFASLTIRMLGQLAATKAAYSNTAFKARGFDNAICAILINSGAYSYTGGNLSNGILRDLPDSPVMLQHTDAALAFGNAKQ